MKFEEYDLLPKVEKDKVMYKYIKRTGGLISDNGVLLYLSFYSTIIGILNFCIIAVYVRPEYASLGYAALRIYPIISIIVLLFIIDMIVGIVRLIYYGIVEHKLLKKYGIRK